MFEPTRFDVLKEMVQNNKIKIKLDRRKSIEHYNEKIYKGEIKLSKFLLRLRTLSTMAGYSLIIGLYCIFFVSPWLYGLLITISAVYVRYMVWKYLKNTAINYTREEILKSEENLKDLYQKSAFVLQNTETGKIARHPEKWTVVLPQKTAN
ncbi:hypothetical protein JOC37_002070 [Desulfohalotomaculum tongense]|uniref:hypothetical protein n=1 Tax=Desulforadius tongensis TaxID=1216062 RepID=UPI00195AF6F1|nr:hypothetical protein [Desulforadius tongensis]MBM7855665.1 hypothetical protein [Desulforadius tongensis]